MQTKAFYKTAKKVRLVFDGINPFDVDCAFYSKTLAVLSCSKLFRYLPYYNYTWMALFLLYLRSTAPCLLLYNPQHIHTLCLYGNHLLDLSSIQVLLRLRYGEHV